MLPYFEMENELIDRALEGIDDIDWYAEANEWCATVAARWGLPTKTVAGIVAALSPQRKWAINLAQTVQFLETNGEVYIHYGTQMHKAQAILAGADPDVTLTGPKENCFYHNLMGCTDKVTIDRHMLRALRLPDKLTPKRYAFALETFGRLSDGIGMTIPQFQACVWSTLADKMAA